MGAVVDVTKSKEIYHSVLVLVFELPFVLMCITIAHSLGSISWPFRLARLAYVRTSTERMFVDTHTHAHTHTHTHIPV